jgi:hypothetical protein
LERLELLIGGLGGQFAMVRDELLNQIQPLGTWHCLDAPLQLPVHLEAVESSRSTPPTKNPGALSIWPGGNMRSRQARHNRRKAIDSAGKKTSR